MADDIDLATERTEMRNQAALQAILNSQPRALSSGVCACGELIDAERLRANPYAKLCRDCAEEAEEERMRKRRLGC